MHIIYTIVLIAMISLSLLAQNLVPNPGFENNTGCPSSEGQLNLVNDWFDHSINPSTTPDYFNTCSATFPPSFNSPWGPQAPRTGNAYMGIFGREASFPDFREYIEVSLNVPLEPCALYEFEMYVSLNDRSGEAMDKMGAWFFQGAIDSLTVDTPFSIAPQVASPAGVPITDTANWVQVSGSFWAVGGEDHLMIGFFGKDSTHTIVSVPPLLNPFPPPRVYAYYYIDDVSLIKVDTTLSGINIGPDTTICSNESRRYVLTADNTNGEILWSTGDTMPSVTVTQSGSYWVRLSLSDSCFKADTAQVIFTNCDSFSIYIPNAFSPNGDGINDRLKIKQNGLAALTWKIYDRWGQLIFESEDLNAGWNGRMQDKPMNKGVYTYMLEGRNKAGNTIFRKGNVTLLL